MQGIQKAQELMTTRRQALVEYAQTELERIRSQPRDTVSGNLLYQLVDQDGFDELFRQFGLTDDECIDLAAAPLAIGDIDIWIEAANNLGYTDWIAVLNDVKINGI